MRQDDKDKSGSRSLQLLGGEEHLQDRNDVAGAGNHIVFDFSGLNKPDVADLALILTARLKTPPHESVWVRAINPRTARVLRALGLDHLFRYYPGSDVMN
jgi:anti-anti-sigma regulatory factor